MTMYFTLYLTEMSRNKVKSGLLEQLDNSESVFRQEIEEGNWTFHSSLSLIY